jgi:4-amino-4-deoxy-L-arabinose transferase-like glycosyltransferase
MPSSNFKQYFHLALVVLVAVLLRLYFQVGHIFSDDAYYSHLSYTLLDGNFNIDYFGYPVFPLRIGFIAMNAISMKIFGVNEFATLFFPFFFSILNIFLTYKLTELITASMETALLSALLIAFFPTDIIFATIGFPDLINIFFINFGIYWLYKSYCENKKFLSYLGGLSLFFSMQFKETIYYDLILLIVLLVYILIKSKKLNFQITIGLLFIVANYFIE